MNISKICTSDKLSAAADMDEVLHVVHIGLYREPASFLLHARRQFSGCAHHMMSKLASSSAARPFSTEYSVRHFGQLSFFIPPRAGSGRSISSRQPSLKVWPHLIIRGSHIAVAVQMQADRISRSF